MCLKFLITSISVIKAQKTRNRIRKRRDPNWIEVRHHHPHSSFLIFIFASADRYRRHCTRHWERCSNKSDLVARHVSCLAWYTCVCTLAYSPRWDDRCLESDAGNTERKDQSRVGVQGRCHLSLSPLKTIVWGMVHQGELQQPRLECRGGKEGKNTGLPCIYSDWKRRPLTELWEVCLESYWAKNLKGGE